jgi:hypothetical protein
METDGIMALILFAASVFAFFYGISMAANTVSCALSSHTALKSAGNGVALGQVIMISGSLGTIIALTFAGAGPATKQGSAACPVNSNSGYIASSLLRHSNNPWTTKYFRNNPGYYSFRNRLLCKCVFIKNL